MSVGFPKDTLRQSSKPATSVRPKSSEMILILNPNSQGGTTGKNWDETYRKTREFLPKHHQIIFTKKAGDGTIITRKLLKEGYKNIVAMGGDGTINEIANGFFEFRLQKHKSAIDYSQFKHKSQVKPINSAAILWIIPSGTCNVLARSLDLQYQSIDSLTPIRLMKRRKVDIIGATVTDRDNPSVIPNRLVLNAAEIGAGAEISVDQ